METIRKKKICIIYLRLTDVRVKPTAFHQIRRIDWGSLVVIPLEISQYVIDHRAIDTLPLQFDIACTHFLHNLRFKSFQTLLRTWQFRWRILGNGTLYIRYLNMLHVYYFFAYVSFLFFLFYAVSFPAVNHFSRRCIEFCRQKGITTGITIYIHVECIIHQ